MSELLNKIEETLKEGEYMISDDGIIIEEVLVYAEIVEFIQKK